jgi:hypothetical protein
MFQSRFACMPCSSVKLSFCPSRRRSSVRHSYFFTSFRDSGLGSNVFGLL